jgi:hypothetical protein
MTVYEVATIPIKAGVDLDDKSEAPGKIWEDVLRTISGQDGASKLWW